MADLGRLDEGVRLPDGTGYLGTLNVYHELHCIVSCQSFQSFSNRDAYARRIKCTDGSIRTYISLV